MFSLQCRDGVVVGALAFRSEDPWFDLCTGAEFFGVDEYLGQSSQELGDLVFPEVGELG